MSEWIVAGVVVALVMRRMWTHRSRCFFGHCWHGGDFGENRECCRCGRVEKPVYGYKGHCRSTQSRLGWEEVAGADTSTTTREKPE